MPPMGQEKPWRAEGASSSWRATSRGTLTRRVRRASGLTAKDRSSRRRLYSWAERGRLVNPAPGCFADPEQWATLSEADKTLFIMRAIQRENPHYLFCGPSAAVAWGLFEPACYMARPFVATSPVAHSSSSKNLVSVGLPETERGELVDGLLVTDLVRSAFDGTRILGFRRGLGLCDGTALFGGLSAADLLERFEDMPRARGAAVARRCASRANPLSENGGESYARAAMIELGFAEPLLQVPIADPMDAWRGPYRAEFFWTGDVVDREALLMALANGALGTGDASGCIAGELDGWGKTFDPRLTGGRGARHQLLAERRREARLTRYGIRVVRFSFEEACDDAYFSRLLGSYGVPRA